MKTVDWEKYALDMCALLDEIEFSVDDPERVHVLVHGRFALAERHGMTVEFERLPPGSRLVQ